MTSRLTDLAASRSHERADFALVIVSTVVKVCKQMKRSESKRTLTLCRFIENLLYFEAYEFRAFSFTRASIIDL